MRTLEEALNCVDLHTVLDTDQRPRRLYLRCKWLMAETTSDVCRLCKHHKTTMEDTDGTPDA